MQRRRQRSKTKSINLVAITIVVMALVVLIYKAYSYNNEHSVLGSFIAQTSGRGGGEGQPTITNLPRSPSDFKLPTSTSIPPTVTNMPSAKPTSVFLPTATPPVPKPTSPYVPTEIPSLYPMPTFSVPTPTVAIVSPSSVYSTPSPTPIPVLLPPPNIVIRPNIPIIVRTNDNTSVNLVDNNINVKINNDNNQISAYIEILPTQFTVPTTGSTNQYPNPIAFTKPTQVLTTDKNVFDIVTYWLELNHIRLTPLASGGFLIEHQGVTAQTPYPLSINLPRNVLAAHTPGGPINILYPASSAVPKAIYTQVISKVSDNQVVYLQFQTFPKPGLYYIFPGQSEKFCFAFWPATLKRTVFVSAQTNEVDHVSEPLINHLLDILCL